MSSHRKSHETNPMLADIADDLVDLLHARGVLRCCPDCQWWDNQGETCGKYLARPPATVIANGCDEFEPTIPF